MEFAEENIKVKKVGFGYYFWKRFFDICSSFFAIVILLPLLFLCALCVIFSSKGPVLFKDIRVGKNEKKIKVLKFRSMYIDAEEHPEKYFSPDQIQQWKEERKVENDPRITPVGRFLRKTSLDELPQLFNILFGSMSVVGPRPLSEKELDDHFTTQQRKLLLSVRPGLTGYWQVYGRSDCNYESGNRVKMNMVYFEKRSLLFDLKLIFMTVPAVFHHRGAR